MGTCCTPLVTTFSILRFLKKGFDFFSSRGYDKVYREGKKVLLNLIDIPVPVIAALNGATTVHSEYALLANIVIATPETMFQDKPHFAFGIVPGDGVHLLWPDGRGRTSTGAGRARNRVTSRSRRSTK